jgi:hypothetical protein
LLLNVRGWIDGWMDGWINRRVDEKKLGEYLGFRKRF